MQSVFNYEYTMIEPKEKHEFTTPIMFALHDAGSNEKHVLERIEPFTHPRLRLIGIRGPAKIGPDQYAWLNNGRGAQDPLSEIDTIHAGLIRFMLDAKQEYSPVLSRMYLYAEGQGATLALLNYVGSFHVSQVSTYICVGAILPVIERPKFNVIDVGRRKMHLVHGARDELAPIELARDQRDWLVNGGAKPTYKEYDMGHHVTAECLSDIQKWIGPVLLRSIRLRCQGEECYERKR